MFDSRDFEGHRRKGKLHILCKRIKLEFSLEFGNHPVSGYKHKLLYFSGNASSSLITRDV